jgi:hypothetical protein
MTISAWPRRVALATIFAAPVLLAGCSSDAPLKSYPKLSFDYLTKLRLNVATVDIDEANPPVRDVKDMAILAPNKPVDVLRDMAQQRLLANASSGRAVFVIDQASIVNDRDKLRGTFAVHLDVATSDGNKTGYAEARVSRTTDYSNDGPNATRATLDKLITDLMTDMNVEFEYQVRRSLRSYLQSGSAPPPIAKPVQIEELAPAGQSSQLAPSATNPALPMGTLGTLPVKP